MPLDIKKKITWTLKFPDETIGENGMLTFDQPLFLEDKVNDYDVLMLLNILQEVYYVTHLDRNFPDIQADNIPVSSNVYKDNLDRRDDGWDSLSSYFGKLLNRISENYDLLIDDTSYKNSNELKSLKGKLYVDYIQNEMGDVYLFRYEVFSILKSLIPLSYRRKNRIELCTDIVCDSKSFQNFFNFSLEWIEVTQRNLQINESNALENLLRHLSKKCDLDEVNTIYIDGRGCFSNTVVQENDHMIINLLCFSGPEDPIEDLKTQIESIANCGYFENSKLVNVKDEIKYFISENEYITLGEAKRSGLYSPKSHRRMFSCCERKTFAYYNLHNCDAFRMVVKYAPCELCKHEVSMYEDGFKKLVISGKALDPLKRITEYNDLAYKIYRMFHPIKFPIIIAGE